MIQSWIWERYQELIHHTHQSFGEKVCFFPSHDSAAQETVRDLPLSLSSPSQNSFLVVSALWTAFNSSALKHVYIQAVLKKKMGVSGKF